MRGLAIIWLLCVAGGFRLYLARPNYVATATLRLSTVMRPDPDKSEVEAAELCLAQQRYVMTSPRVLTRALARVESDHVPSGITVPEFARMLRIERRLFEPKFRVSVLAPEPTQAQVLLLAVLDAYVEDLGPYERALLAYPSAGEDEEMCPLVSADVDYLLPAPHRDSAWGILARASLVALYFRLTLVFLRATFRRSPGPG